MAQQHSASSDDLQVVVDQEPQEASKPGLEEAQQPAKQHPRFTHPKTWSKNAKLGAGLGLLSLLALPLIIAPAVIVPKQKAAAAEEAAARNGAPSSLHRGGAGGDLTVPLGNNSLGIRQVTPATFDVAREPVSPFVRINGGQVRVVAGLKRGVQRTGAALRGRDWRGVGCQSRRAAASHREIALGARVDARAMRGRGACDQTPNHRATLTIASSRARSRLRGQNVLVPLINGRAPRCPPPRSPRPAPPSTNARHARTQHNTV